MSAPSRKHAGAGALPRWRFIRHTQQQRIPGPAQPLPLGRGASPPASSTRRTQHRTQQRCAPRARLRHCWRRAPREDACGLALPALSLLSAHAGLLSSPASSPDVQGLPPPPTPANPSAPPAFMALELRSMPASSPNTSARHSRAYSSRNASSITRYSPWSSSTSCSRPFCANASRHARARTPQATSVMATRDGESSGCSFCARSFRRGISQAGEEGGGWRRARPEDADAGGGRGGAHLAPHEHVGGVRCVQQCNKHAASVESW